MALHEVQRLVRVLERRELHVGLVEDHATCRGSAATNASIASTGSGGGRGVVGVADDHDARGRGDLARPSRRGRARPSQSSGTLIARAPRHRRQVRVHRERGPGVHDLRARLEHRLGRRQQDLAGAVARRRRARRARPCGPRSAGAAGAGRVRIAVEPLSWRLHRLEHGGVRRPGRLVGGELHQLAVERVGRGRRIDRDPPAPCC